MNKEWPEMVSRETVQALEDRAEKAETERCELLSAMDILVTNAVMRPDPGMNGTTDCYCIPLGDIEVARSTIARVLGL